MKKIFLFILISIIAALAIVSASLFSRSTSITGNSILDIVSETDVCEDVDEGLNPETASYVLVRRDKDARAKANKDSCTGRPYRIWDEATDRRIKVWPSIKEGYCDDAEGGIGAVAELTNTSVINSDGDLLGEGYCKYVKIDVRTRSRKQNVAQWVSTSGQSTCRESESGVVYVNGERMPNGCDSTRKNYTVYSCDDTGNLESTVTNCAENHATGRCGSTGCIRRCTDTESNNNPNLPGKVTADNLEGDDGKDMCDPNNDGRVRQWYCGSDGKARIKKSGNTPWQRCRSDQHCNISANAATLGLAYCKYNVGSLTDVGARTTTAQTTASGAATAAGTAQTAATTAQTTADTAQTTADTAQTAATTAQTTADTAQTDITTLTTRINTLESVLCAVNPAYSFCP